MRTQDPRRFDESRNRIQEMMQYQQEHRSIEGCIFQGKSFQCALTNDRVVMGSEALACCIQGLRQ